MVNYALNYLFINGFSDRPAYQVMSNGDLLKFAPGSYQIPVKTVGVSSGEVRELLRRPLSKTSLVQRCNDLFERRSSAKDSPEFIKGDDEVKLSELFDSVRDSLK
jgi:hypothetical protein